MIERLVRAALEQRGVVLLGSAMLVALGLLAASRLPLDAVPDVTNVQVQVNTEVAGMGPVEVEKLVTVPIETALSGLPDVAEVRSLSKYGLSQVTVVFHDQVDIYFARQLVGERLQAAREELPGQLDLNPTMSPVSTGLGEVYQYTLVRDPAVPPAAMIRAVQRQVAGFDPGQPDDPATLELAELMALRAVQDWIVRRQLLRVPGVAEVNAFGGHVRQYQVWLDPQRLLAHDLTIGDVLEALERNNANAGGAYIEKGGEAQVVRGIGLVQRVEDLEAIVLRAVHGTPIHLHDVATVVFDGEVRMGATTRDGEGEQVAGIVMTLLGANARTTVAALKEQLREVGKSLPAGVRIEPYYDRQELVDRTVRTAFRNLLEGGILVVVVLYLVLGSLRGSLIVAAVIPLAMLGAVVLMVQAKISGNLMSLGALDFGILVDGAVVVVENALRLLHQPGPRDRRQTVLEATLEVARPVAFGITIILIVYLPILTLQGVEGRLFKPLAYTVMFALVGALLVTLTTVPVLASYYLRRSADAGRQHADPDDPSGEDTRLAAAVRRAYRPALAAALRRPRPVVVAALAIFGASLVVFPRLGSVFIPRLDEGSFALQIIRLPATSLTQSVAIDLVAERLIKELPEVRTVVARAGRAEIATDPMGPEISDVFVMLQPPEEWAPGVTKETIREAIERQLERLPGINVGYGQPIELRVNELISGVRSDVAVKVFGPDFEVLDRLSNELAELLRGIRGCQDLQVEQTAGLPGLDISIDRAALARHGLNVDDVRQLIEVGIGGGAAGEVLEGDARYAIVARLQPSARRDAAAIGDLLLASPTGERVPLRDVARLERREGPAQISREEASRRKVVEFNVRGRDIGSFVSEAQRRIDQSVALPPGYSLDWGGQFENLQRARARLLVVVPAALGLIFGLLYLSFGNVRQALLIFANVPFAVSGGIFALWLRGLPFSISAAIGFIALAGLAVLNGVVMISYLNVLRQQGRPLEEAVRHGADVRLRPILMTALTAMLGFLPMAVSHTAGAEVQRPLATVVIGGLVTATLLTLFVLPVLYRAAEARFGHAAAEPGGG
ncbi:MAG: efflux RND transporter permease subunit [Fimbriimonadaceae bacterium]|nr:efflux RND transporter permease subunit [Fimbriimonadaceae bacterium]